jgi:hypothetical protein
MQKNQLKLAETFCACRTLLQHYSDPTPTAIHRFIIAPRAECHPAPVSLTYVLTYLSHNTHKSANVAHSNIVKRNSLVLNSSFKAILKTYFKESERTVCALCTDRDRYIRRYTNRPPRKRGTAFK